MSVAVDSRGPRGLGGAVLVCGLGLGLGLGLVAVVLALRGRVVRGPPRPGMDRATSTLLANVELACAAYRQDEGFYPGARGDLNEVAQAKALFAALCESPEDGGGRNAPYLGIGWLREVAVITRDAGSLAGLELRVLRDADEAEGTKVLVDPWGHPLRYREWESRAPEVVSAATPHHATGFDVWSVGRDGKDQSRGPRAVIDPDGDGRDADGEVIDDVVR